MSHASAFFTVSVAGSDIFKIVLFLLGALAVSVLARLASGETRPGPLPPQGPAVTTVVSARPHVPASEPPRVFASAAPGSLEPLRITKFFFKTFDVVPGPPVPEVFADELFLELHNADTDHRWTQSYYVATPQGLAQVLKEESWKYLYAPEVLVVPRYNLDDIRRAVETRLREDNEFLNSAETKEESV